MVDFKIKNLTLVLSTYLSKDSQSHTLKHSLKINCEQWQQHLEKHRRRPPQDNLPVRHKSVLSRYSENTRKIAKERRSLS